MENIKIKKIPLNDRPRERLMNYGPESLSNEELLSIILNSGSKDISVKNLASKILSVADGICNFNKITYHDLINIKGVGKVKACIVLAFCELSKRTNMSMPTLNNVKLDGPIKVFEYYKYKLDNNQERVYCIYLDPRKRVIKEKLLFIGTVNHSLIHPRDIFKEAFNLNAAYIVCVHNHPSGDVTPSSDDKNVTKRLKEVGYLMGIKLIDHVIVSKNKYYSFLENGKI